MDKPDTPPRSYEPARISFWMSLASLLVGLCLYVAVIGELLEFDDQLAGSAVLLAVGALNKLGLVCVGLAALSLAPLRGTPRDQRLALWGAVIGAIVWGATSLGGAFGLFSGLFSGGFRRSEPQAS